MSTHTHSTHYFLNGRIWNSTLRKEQKRKTGYNMGYGLLNKSQLDCCRYCFWLTVQSERRCDHRLCGVAPTAAAVIRWKKKCHLLQDWIWNMKRFYSVHSRGFWYAYYYNTIQNEKKLDGPISLKTVWVESRKHHGVENKTPTPRLNWWAEGSDWRQCFESKYEAVLHNHQLCQFMDCLHISMLQSHSQGFSECNQEELSFTALGTQQFYVHRCFLNDAFDVLVNM